MRSPIYRKREAQTNTDGTFAGNTDRHPLEMYALIHMPGIPPLGLRRLASNYPPLEPLGSVGLRQPGECFCSTEPGSEVHPRPITRHQAGPRAAPVRTGETYSKAFLTPIPIRPDLRLGHSSATRCSKSPSTSSICPSADRRSSAISCASKCGSGRLAESSRLSSRSQKMSRLTLSRATISSYV